MYPVYVFLGDGHHAHGVTFPDFPGCFAAADDMQDLPSAIQDAVEAHFHGSTDPLPPPSSLLSLSQHPDYQGGIWLLANIDQDRLGYNLSSNSPPESAPLESRG